MTFRRCNSLSPLVVLPFMVQAAACSPLLHPKVLTMKKGKEELSKVIGRAADEKNALEALDESPPDRELLELSPTDEKAIREGDEISRERVDERIFMVLIKYYMDPSEEIYRDPETYFLKAPLIPIHCMTDLRFDIPVVINERVRNFIRYFTNSGRKYFKRWLERSKKYEALIEEALKKEGLPKDLKYLAMIESGYSAFAYSRARASGLWQFMAGTATREGLRVDWWIDERRDVERSTLAATRHLKSLYRKFADWNLVAAAYNSGPGKVMKAIEKYGVRDYWHLIEYPFFREETKNYVPKWIAAAIISKNPSCFGFENIEYEESPPYVKVPLEFPCDLELIARCADTSLDTIKSFNAELRRWCTPPDYPGYEIKIPSDKYETFIKNMKNLKPSERTTFVRHQIKKGETLSHLAARYDIPVKEIMRTNRIKDPRRIRAGTFLIIPLPGGSSRGGVLASCSSKKSSSSKGTGQRGKVVYRVEKGDYLSLIARRFGVDVVEIKEWNHLNKKGTIYTGQELTLFVEVGRLASAPDTGDKEIKYKVQKGDCLSVIAEKFGIRIDDIRRWNHLNREGTLYIGQELTLMIDGDFEGGDAAPAGRTKVRSYTVKKGDSLWKIARENNVLLEDLLKWNNLERDSKLYPGNRLIIMED